MGRLDEAFRRSNVDVARGTGAPPWPAAGSIGLFQQHPPVEPRDVAPWPATAPATPAPDNAPAADEGRPAAWEQLDPVAVQRLVVSRTPSAMLLERFRSLAATLIQAQAEQSLKSLMVTSASPREGKSLVAINLALTLADSYRLRVLLVDGDLRRPTLHLMLRVRNGGGLAEVLESATQGSVHPVQITNTFALLPAGRARSNPLGSLSSDRMKQVVLDAGSPFDWVIVDSPPVGVLADARLVCQAVDAAILVVRAGVTQLADAQNAADTLGRDRILGVVLNAVDPTEIRGEDYYRHYYDERE